MYSDWSNPGRDDTALSRLISNSVYERPLKLQDWTMTGKFCSLRLQDKKQRNT